MRGLGSITLALALALALASGGCADPAAEGPRPLTVTPDRGPVSQAVPVIIRGVDFNAAASTDFAGREESALDSRFAAFLGPVALRDVRLQPDGSIAATVPEGLPIGPHDLEVVDPTGRRGSLPEAFRVLADTDTAQLVDGYRIDAVGPQRAWSPFQITVTAVDAAGAPVTAFNGAVSLSDLTGTAVPGTAALFSSGVWSGAVEVRSAHAADQLTAVDGLGHTGTSNPFRVAPSPAIAVEFITPARTTTAGDCSGPSQPLTIRLLDAFGGATVADGEVALTPIASPGLAFFGDEGCTVPATAPAVASGASTVTVWYRSTLAGANPVELSAPSLLAATQVETVAAGPPASLVFVTPPQTVNAGACAQATLELRDAWGNAALGAPVVIDLAASAAPGFELFQSDDCSGTTASSVVPAPGTARAAFSFIGTVAEQVTVTAGSPGLTGDAQTETITPEGSASRLVFLTPPRTPRAGACSDLVTLQAQDSFGNAVAGAGAIQVALSASPAAGFDFFTDELCTAPAAAGTTQIGAGLSTAGVYFRGTIAGAVDVTANATALTAASQVEQVRPGLPAQLAFTSAPQSVAAGACSGLTGLALRDAFGNGAVNETDELANPYVPPSAITVTFTAAPFGGFTFYSDALCATPSTQATIAAGAGGTGVYFKGTVAGSVTVEGKAPPLLPASQDETIRPAPADRLAFSTSAQTVVAGECSGVVTVEARDTLGNAATLAGGAAITLTAAPAAGTAWFSDAACGTPLASLSIPAGGSSASFFFQSTRAGALGVTAAALGLTSATQPETVLPEPADRLVVTTPPQTVPAGLCSSALLLEARDRFGNPSPLPAGATVALAASPPDGFLFHDGAGCGSAATTVAIAPGGATATFSFAGTVAGSVTLTATSAPLAPAAQVETIAPLAPDRLAFATAPQSVNATRCSQGVVVQVHDSLGNPSPVAAPTHVALANDAATGFEFYSEATCSPLNRITGVDLAIGETTDQFWFSGTVAETVTVTASSALLASATQDETLTPDGNAIRLVFLTPPRSVAAGGCSEVVTVEQRDSGINGVPATVAVPVTLAALPAAGLAFFEDAACSLPIPPGALEIGPGSTSVGFHFSGTAAGTVQVTAGAAGLADAVQTETILPGNPTELVFTSGPQSVRAGSCSAAVGLALRDTFGNAAPAAAPVDVALGASPNTAFTFFSDGVCGTPATSLTIGSVASATTFSFRGNATGSFTVTATAASLPSSPTQVETITPGSPHHLAFTTAPQTVIAGSCSPATIQSQDLYDNPSPVTAGATVNLTRLPTAGFAFYSNPGCTSVITSVAIAPAGSDASFWFKGTVIGSVTVTASATGLTAAAQVETLVPAPPDRLAFTTTAQTVVAGVCSGPVTVQSRDPFGNASAPASDVALTLVKSGPAADGLSFFPAAGCGGGGMSSVVLGGGTSSVSFWFLGTASGSVPVTARASATVPLWTEASQTETVTPAATSRFFWGTVATPQAQDRAFPVRIEARDAFNNPTPAFIGTAALSLSTDPPAAPTLTCRSGCTVGLTTGAFTAGVWTGSVSVSAPKSPTEGTPDRRLVATSGSGSGTSNDFEVTGAPDQSPPTAVLTATPQVVTAGGTIVFSAAGSTDYQTLTANLEVSWDLTGAAALPPDPAVPNPALPWTAWSTTKATAPVTFATAGTFSVTVAVRDTDGEVGYARIRVYVLPTTGARRCVVNEAGDTDNGGTCIAPGTGLSLREAIDHVEWGGIITFAFAGPTTITGSGTYTIDQPIRIVGPGITINAKTLDINDGDAANPVILDGLEFTGQTTPVRVYDNRTVIMRDVYFHDSAGIRNGETLTLERARFARCTGSCIRLETYDATLDLSHSELRGAGTDTAIRVDGCDAAHRPLTLQSNVFEGFQTGILLGCPGPTTILHNTFEANDTGIAYYAGGASAGHLLRNNIFSGQRTTAASCGAATFASPTDRDFHLLWLNASDGCLAGDPDIYALNPLYAFPAAGDFRLRPGSPAIDSATLLTPQPQLLPAYPGATQPAFLGDGPDRGGRETY